MKFQHQSRAITVENKWKILFNHPNLHLVNINAMHIQNLIEIHKLLQKILSINKILMSIKGNNSVKNWQKTMCIRYNMDPVFINVYTKFYQIHLFVLKSLRLKLLRKNTFSHQSRAITLLFINEFSPFAIPNHSSLISMSMQSLKKIGQKLLKLESGNEALTIGRTDTQNFRRV